jgi:hypothetical protein
MSLSGSSFSWSIAIVTLSLNGCEKSRGCGFSKAY